MKKISRHIALLLAFVMLFSAMVMTLASCGESECKQHADSDSDGKCDNCGADYKEELPDEGDGGSTDSNTKVGYTVSVKTIGGMPMSDVTVYTYADNTLSDLVDYGITDENGLATISMKRSSSYVFKLSGVPKGYDVADYYSFNGNSASIVLESSVIEENYVPSKYSLGDIMYDFTVTTTDGKTFKLSEALKTKKAVLVNFWFSTCSPCINEFPYLDSAAQKYQDDIAVIALNTYATDDEAAVEMFKSTYELSLDMAKADNSLFAAFGTGGYPTSVMIDKYGTICLIEVGGLPSEKPFVAMFEHFSAENYQQKIIGSIDELTPRIEPTVDMPSSEEMGGVLNSGDISVVYTPETESKDANFSWPFVITEKNGVACIKAANSEQDGSFATLHATFNLKAGEAIGFDYLSSTEAGSDILYVLLDGLAMVEISGDSKTDWSSCYPFVAVEDGEYKVTFIYNKDGDTDTGDDTVYIKNMRVLANPDEIDVATYIPRVCATDPKANGDGFESYAHVVYNSEDGYYHVCVENHEHQDGVCKADGPLLLADLMGYTLFSDTDSVYSLAYYNKVVDGNGKNYYDEIILYCNYASNATIGGLCTVNQPLRELLEKVADIVGFESNPNQWLQFCKYYQAYGTDGVQLADPIKGLAPHSAYETIVNEEAGLDEFPNAVTYDRVIMPRGLWFAFTPKISGVYRILSNTKVEVDGWIFGADRTEYLVYDNIERTYTDYSNVNMIMYFEAGTTYYIDIAYYDVYQYGTINFKVEYVGESCEIFRYASPGVFTFALDSNGEITNTMIHGGIDVIFDEESGYYREKRADGTMGSIIYADFTLYTALFNKAIYISPDVEGTNPDNDLLSLGGFDFTGLDYTSLEGTVSAGTDMTSVVESYIEKMISSEYNVENEDSNAYGCVAVDKQLAEILQNLVDRYSFKNVKDSWTKLCYYYEYYGPAVS